MKYWDTLHAGLDPRTCRTMGPTMDHGHLTMDGTRGWGGGVTEGSNPPILFTALTRSICAPILVSASCIRKNKVTYVISGATGKVVHIERTTHKRRPVATAGVMLFQGPQARRYTQKAVPTQGSAHKRRPVATAGVMLFQGSQARQYTHNAVCTKGGRRFAAGRTTARRCRPNFRPKSSTAVSAGRFRPAGLPPSFSAEDRRRAPPPFHSDELWVR